MFGRLTGLIVETVGRSAYTQLGIKWSPAENFETAGNKLHERVFFTSTTSVPVKKLKEVAREALAKLAKHESYPYIEAYFSAWNDSSYMNYLTPGLYGNSGFIISSKAAHQSLTPQRSKRVLDKVQTTISCAHPQ